MPESINSAFLADHVAVSISKKWTEWNASRSTWLDTKKELRQYIFATSTRDTSNAKLPWKNSTVTPKLTQLRDNLHANYMAALFPRTDWFDWTASDKSSNTHEKRENIKAYMRTKLDASDFDVVVSQLVLDYIDYGNVFVGHEYVRQTKKDPVSEEEEVVYEGPKAFRISPLDIVFDPTSVTFQDSPCIVRRLRSLGDLEKDILTKPYLEYDKKALDKAHALRLAPADQIDAVKNDGLNVDGFGSLQIYLNTGMVELLDFYGDIYDQTTKTYHKDMVITVVDRRWILRMGPNKSWTGSRPIRHCGWRLRPDNLWAQGPLDQLVGMQYRIDHLENLKADVYDQIAHPVVIVKGETVEDFTFGPGAIIHVGTDGNVEFARPEAAALAADTEIHYLMALMEELAGAPKQAMGIRTPGEKTKYEVQVLENGAGRIFQSKVNWFERNIIEPLLDSMLEESVRNMSPRDSVLITDPELGTQTFKDISKDDIVAKGRFSAIGARHFAEQATFVQELTQTLQLVDKIPSIAAHISGKNTAHALSETLGWETFDIVKDNAMVMEQQETQRLVQAASSQLQQEDQTPAELQSGDYSPPGGPPSPPPDVPRNTA